MKKKILIIVFIMTICIIPYHTKALTKEEISSRNVCANYEVGIAIESIPADPTSTSIKHISCHNTYNEALQAMNNSSHVDTILLERKNNYTKIINAKYAILDLSLRGENVTYYYPTSTSNSYDNYLVTSASTGAADGAFLDFDPNTRRAKVKIAGYTGWVNEDAYNIVPLMWTYSISYYVSRNNEFKHNFTSNIVTLGNNRYGIAISKLPEGLSNNVYYFSYDGHYFYKDQYKMIDDYRNGNYNNAVNKNTPFYNYYQYLPNHSKTNYSAVNINQYIREGLGYTYSTFGNTLYIKDGFDTNLTSKLYGMGTYFKYAEEQYGANAILSLGLNRNESADGRSKIAISKNNGFGEGAVDSSPFGSAYGFLTYQGGIYNHAQHFVTDLYENANHYYYNGGHYGNKQGGWNIMYASDPFWGEKAASYYYRFDRYNGFQDYNFYQLAINTTSTVARSNPSTSAKQVYTLKDKEIPVIILEEVKGDTVNGNNTWYKIISDMNLNSNKDSYSYYAEKFDWDNSYVYVPSSYFKKINTAKDGIKNMNDVFPHTGNNYTYSYYNNGSELTPKIGKIINNTPYYYDGALVEKTNKTLLKDKIVMVYDRAIDQNGNVISYQVTSDYHYDQKEWISAKDIEIIGGKYGKQVVEPVGYSSLVFEKATESSKIISTIYDGCYVPIIEELTGLDGKTYLKVPVSLNDNNYSYGYTLKSDTGAYMNIYENKEQVAVNHEPELTVSDKEIVQGTNLDLKTLVKATDTEDGDITSKVVITSKLDINTPGVYEIKFEVTDSKNSTVSKTAKVTVIKDEEPVITASDITINENDSFNPKQNVTAYDKEDKDLTSKIEVTENTVNTSKKGTYKVTYKVTDSYKHTVTKTITVTVLEVTKETQTENTETKEIVQKQQKEGALFLKSLSFDKTKNKYEISGYLIIKNNDNKYSDNIVYNLVLKDKNSGEEHLINISRWKDNVPFNIGENNGYDYSGSWFKGYLDFSEKDLAGDYDLYIEAANDKVFAREKLTNLFNIDITRRSEDGTYGYNFKVELSSRTQEITLSIRNNKLITTSVSNTYRNMVNLYQNVKFTDNKLNLVGTSYNYGISYDSNNFVERKLILENTKTYKQYSYDLGSTNNGLYKVEVGDNKDKSLVWYDKTIDISNLDKGTYSLIVYTKTKDVADYGDIIDMFGILSSKTTTINNKKYTIKLNEKRDNRLELIVE